MNTEELELLSDSKYRQFINAVEKALRSFEYSSEWADLISALGKLNKVLQNHTKFKVLPRKLTIGKRLAQCMHPTLPSGVHLKALETYELIFKRIGHKGLAQDLFIYSAGLFPLLGNAAMSTRPVLMNMYENYFLPLGKALLPGLSGLLLGLLPGIEEGSEYTDRTISLLGSFSENTDKNIFYTTLWGCVYSSASIRLPAVTFIMTRLNKKGAGKQKYILGNDIPLLVQAVSAALRDNSLLVQRNMLDFLLLFLPVNTTYLSSNEKVTLVASGLEVLLRRDMSLNRRLYTWLLGTNSAKTESASRTDSVCSNDADPEEPQETFFSMHSRPLVIEGVRKIFQTQTSIDREATNGAKKLQRLQVLKPFRMLISLLDKPEIGGSILEDVLLDVFRALYSQCKVLKENGAAFEETDRKDSFDNVAVESGVARTDSAKTKLIDELIKTANLLFNAFEPYFMWEYIAKLLSDCDKSSEAGSKDCNGKGCEFTAKVSVTSWSEVFRLTDFILDVVTLEADVEIQTEHWPELLRRITMEMTKCCDTMTLGDVKEGISLCSRLLSKVMPSMKTVEKERTEPELSVNNENRKKELESSSEHDMNEWGVIELKGTRDKSRRSDMPSETSLENSPEGVVKEAPDSEVFKEEGNKIESLVAAGEKEMVAMAEHYNGEADAANVNDTDTQDELDEWSDFQEGESSSELTATNPESNEEDSSREQKSTLADRSEEKKLSKDTKRLFQPSLIQACVKYFQNFYAKFCVQRVLKHVSSFCFSDETVGGIINKECHTALRASGIVNDAMWKQIKEGETNLVDKFVRDTYKPQTNLKGRSSVAGPTALVSSFRSVQSNKSCAEAFAAACKLLLELSCFPVWAGNESKSEKSATDGNEDSNLPEWLQSLIMCCFEVSEFDIQSSAVGTLLDLINLTLSVNAGHAHGLKSSAPVVVVPMISQQALGVIEKSGLYEVIAESLWDQLKEDTTQFHQRIVELFLQLHNLTASPSLCANVIGNSLIDISKEVSLQGHWKFAVFWHVARNVVIQDSGRSSRLGEFRTLDRALFIMVDSLQNEEPEIRVLTQHWLAHALQHGDLGRIIDPLLLLLLHPVTARVSIHYLYQLFDYRMANILSDTKRKETKTFNNVKVHSVKEIENNTSPKPSNDRVKQKPKVTSANNRESDESKTTSPSGPSEAEHSTDTDGDGADADDENEENDPTKDKPKDTEPVKAPQSPPPRRSHVHPLDQHKLLYILHYDSQLTLYAFTTLQTILMHSPHQFVCASSTTSISSSNTPHQEKIKELLIRHRRSLLGKGFYGALYESPVSPSGPAHSARLFGGPLMYLKPSNSKYLEVLISVSLYFIRSEYSSHLQVQPEDIDGNVQVQLASTELLLGVMWQLVEVVKESGAGFGTYISDLFSRCKVQKALLHCLLSTLYERTGVRTSSKATSPTLTSGHLHVSSEISQSQARAFQIKLIKLVQAVLILESNIHTAVAISQETAAGHGTPPPSKPESPAKVSDDAKVTQSSHRYIPGKSLAEQGMLLSSVLHGLRNDEPDMHYEWLQFVITCLSHLGMQLRTWVVPVVEHLCRILERLTTVYAKDKDSRTSRRDGNDEFGKRRLDADGSSIPPDYMVTLLESLASICHSCLRDNTTPQTPVLSLKPRAGRSNSSPNVSANPDPNQSSTGSNQIFTNLLHAFSVQSAPVSDVPSVEVPKNILDAREGLLSVLPKILSSLFTVWSTWSPQRADSTGQRLPSEWSLNLMGSPKAVRQQILQLLTPITMNHTIVFLASLADVWYQRRRREGSGVKSVRAVPVASEDQIIVVDIVYAIKALSVEEMIDNVKQIVRQVVTSKDKTTPTQAGLEVNILQFLFEYLHKASESHLILVRSSLLSLMKEGLQLNFPPALFLLLIILRSYVENIPLQEDKKVRKELQDITQRLVEACNTVAGSSLENAAWFRRTLAVIPQPEVPSDQSSNMDSETSEAEPAAPPTSVPSGSTASNTSSYSTQALYVLAEVLAPVLDMVFGSDEKERMTSFLTTVMYNVTPFLKNHSPHNVPSFRACCNLLASLSGYQYTRRAWKKEVMELLLDPSFFQMDITCIGSWRTIIDNLMTQDNTSFKELMARVAGLSQSASINIFANREQEMEQRAQLLKKLSFTIFCSEVDQYQYVLPEIQERLAESLRLPQSPVVHEQIFLFFRVLILRMSAQHLTPLWPTIVSEVVHVLLQMESDLGSDGKSHKQRMVISELLLGSNGYVNYSQEKWLGLYLAVCKLLDLSQALPSDYLSQFQLYRWAFEGEAYNMTAGEEKVPVFKPHIARLEKLLQKRIRDQADVEELQRVPGEPLLTMYQIKSLDQLLPFFKCLSRDRYSGYGEMRGKNSKSKSSQSKSLLERVVERDFLEPLVVD